MGGVPATGRATPNSVANRLQETSTVRQITDESMRAAVVGRWSKTYDTPAAVARSKK